MMPDPIPARLRLANEYEAATRLEKAIQDCNEGNITYGQYARIFWQSFKTWKKAQRNGI